MRAKFPWLEEASLLACEGMGVLSTHEIEQQPLWLLYPCMRFDKWQEVRQLWNGETKTKLVKVGTKFQSRWQGELRYEPHLLLELSLERKNRKVNGQEREGEGRMVAPRRCAQGQNLGFERADVQMDGKRSMRRADIARCGKPALDAGKSSRCPIRSRR